MKNKLKAVLHIGWALLTEIPGWPDAPKAMRVRRAAPIVAPFIALVVMLCWTQLVREPRMRAEQALNKPLAALEDEVTSLRMRCSDQQAQELAARTAQSNLSLVEESELRPIIRSLKQSAAEEGWDGAFQTADRAGEQAPEDAQIAFLPLRGKLVAKGANPQSFSRLLTLLDKFNASPKRIDLTRLAIRADEQGGYTTELNLRLVSRLAAHEKNP